MLHYSQQQILLYRKKHLDDKNEDFVHKCKIFVDYPYQEKIFSSGKIPPKQNSRILLFRFNNSFIS